MNIKQAEQRARDLLAAIEAHKRREPVEAANWDEEDWAVMDSPDFNSFGALKYRPAAITFPPCPDAYGWHNPAELDARTVSGLLGMTVDNVAWSRTRRPLPALQYWSSPEHVPPGMVWLRWKGTTEAALLTYIDQHGFRPGWGDLRAWDVLRNAEWSSDRSPGSWKPCTVAP